MLLFRLAAHNNAGTVEGRHAPSAEKAYGVFNALGAIAFAYNFSSVLLEIQVRYCLFFVSSKRVPACVYTLKSRAQIPIMYSTAGFQKPLLPEQPCKTYIHTMVLHPMHGSCCCVAYPPETRQSVPQQVFVLPTSTLLCFRIPCMSHLVRSQT